MLRRSGAVVAVAVLACSILASAEDWSLQYEEIYDDPAAEIAIRYGDIDNLGFGWPDGFDPFSGDSTPAHSYPWDIDPADAKGTDRIMVISSFAGEPPHGNDGYSGGMSRPENDPRTVMISFAAPAGGISSAVLQVFVDDFQSPKYLSSFQVFMNGMRIQELEDILNVLDQSGPIGQLITFQLPDRLVETMQAGGLIVFVDDPVTGAGDGFAFDFFRLLINPRDP